MMIWLHDADLIYRNENVHDSEKNGPSHDGLLLECGSQ